MQLNMIPNILQNAKIYKTKTYNQKDTITIESFTELFLDCCPEDRFTNDKEILMMLLDSAVINQTCLLPVLVMLIDLFVSLAITDLTVGGPANII